MGFALRGNHRALSYIAGRCLEVFEDEVTGVLIGVRSELSRAACSSVDIFAIQQEVDKGAFRKSYLLCGVPEVTEGSIRMNEAIVVIGREAASGTRGAFEELLEVKNKCAYAQELDSTGAVLAKVAATPGAIGYVSLDVVDKTVAALKLDGVDATEDNIKAGKYTLSRPFVMATKGSVSSQSELVQTWFNFVKSDAGKKVIKGVGLILPE